MKPSKFVKTNWFPLWLIPVLAVLAVGTIWLRLYIVRTSYEIAQTEQQIRNQRKDQELLDLQLAKLKSPARLRKIAVEKYKLGPPQPVQVIYLGY